MSSIPYCQECGTEISEDDKFCPKCGAEVSMVQDIQVSGVGNESSGGRKRSVKTSLGLEENVEGALAYLLGFLSGIALFILEEDSHFVRFHALQSIIIFLPLLVLSWILWFVPVLGVLIGLVAVVAWLVGMLKAYQGELFKFPVVGNIAEKELRKM